VKRTFGSELVNSMEQALAYAKGANVAARVVSEADIQCRGSGGAGYERPE
jgi:hypothetical protein